MRRIQKQKPTNLEIKKERKRISNSIDIDRKNLQVLSKKVKEFKGTVKKQDEFLAEKEKAIETLDKFIETRTEKIESLNDKISERKGKLENQAKGLTEIERDRAKAVEKTEKEVERVIQERRGETRELGKKLAASYELLKEAKSERKALLRESKDLTLSVKGQKKELKFLEGQIPEKRIEVGKLLEEVIELKSAKKELKEFPEKVKAKDKELLGIRRKITEAQWDLEKLEKDKKNKLRVFEEKEEALKKRKESLVEISLHLEEKEKRIKTLGNTLQKHLKKQGITHIDVFEEIE